MCLIQNKKYILPALSILLVPIFFLSSTWPQETVAPEPTVEDRVESLKGKKLLTEDELIFLVEYVAEKHAVSSSTLLATINNEAEQEIIDGKLYYDATAKSNYPGEESYGLAQWNLPSGNKNFEGDRITYAQATDPVYSVDLMASYFAKGKQRIWSGYRKL